MMRLDKYLADMQKGTRSQIKTYIKKGRIKVGDIVVTSPDFKIEPGNDLVLMDNIPVEYVFFEYYMLNKPSGVVTATTDKKEKTVLNLIQSKRSDLFPVGRLDKDTEGLLLITNDGQLAHKILSPKNHIDKTYYTQVKGQLDENIATLFLKGLQVGDDFCALPAKLEVLSYDKEKDSTTAYITIQEGKFHQIKRMFAAVGSEVLYLKRVSMGNLKLDTNLKLGEYRSLTSSEIKNLTLLEKN